MCEDEENKIVLKKVINPGLNNQGSEETLEFPEEIDSSIKNDLELPKIYSPKVNFIKSVN